jgi:hypothetical protein
MTVHWGYCIIREAITERCALGIRLEWKKAGFIRYAGFNLVDRYRVSICLTLYCCDLYYYDRMNYITEHTFDGKAFYVAMKQMDYFGRPASQRKLQAGAEVADSRVRQILRDA